MDKRAERQADWQMSRLAGRLADGQIVRQKDWQTDRLTGRLADRQVDRQIGRHID